MPECDFIVEALTFPELEAAIAGRTVDFVLTNPGHYVLLTKRIGMSAPLATLATYDNGLVTTVFGGVIFSRAGQTNLNTLSDIKGKTVAAASTDSMGGYQTQAYELSRNGVPLPQGDQLIVTGMPQDNVVEAVITGRADVGFVRTGVLEGMVHEGKLDMKQVQIINGRSLPHFPWQTSTQLYPEWPFAALPHIDENLARHVAAAIFMLEENTTAMHAMGIHGFVVPNDYTPVADLLKELRLPPFDGLPRFTLNDIWVQYFWKIIVIFLVIALISLQSLRLLLMRRKLEAQHQAVVLQKQQLQESEAHLNAIIENEPECIKLLDQQGHVLQMNPAGLAMIEADSIKQVAESFLTDVILPEYQHAFIQLHQRVLAGETLQMEFEVRGFKGGHRWLETRAVPMQRNNGTVLLGVTRDITERKHIEHALHDSHRNMQSLLNSMAEGAYGIDTNGDCTFVNRSFLRILGYDRADQIIGKHIHDLIHYSHADGSHYPAAECRMYNVLQNRQEFHCADEVFWRQDGASIPVEYWIQPIVTDDILLGAMITFVDISERKKAEQVIRATAQYSRSLIEASLDPLVTISPAGMITDVNAATENVTGIDRNHLIGSNFADYFTEPEKAYDGYRQVLSNGFVTDYPLAIRHASGKITDVSYNASLYRDDNGNILGVFAAARDMTDRKLLQLELESRAHIDYLTGVSNRGYFMEQAEQELCRALRYGKALSVFMMDIDFFKRINDSHGHKAGDTVLKKMAKVCLEELRGVDIVGRFGGEEFAILLPETGQTEASEVAERLRKSLATTTIALNAGVLINFTISIGVTSLACPDDSIDTLLNLAGKALYQAKETGRNKVCVTRRQAETAALSRQNQAS